MYVFIYVFIRFQQTRKNKQLSERCGNAVRKPLWSDRASLTNLRVKYFTIVFLLSYFNMHGWVNFALVYVYEIKIHWLSMV